MIKIGDEVDIEELLFSYFMKVYNDWLIKSSIMPDACSITIDSRFNSDRITVPRVALASLGGHCTKDCPPTSDGKDQLTEAQLAGSIKAKVVSGTIYERVEERGRLKTGALLKSFPIVKDNFEDRMASIFTVSGEEVIEIENLIFQLRDKGGLNCRERIINSCKDGKYSIKTVNGVEHVRRKP